MESLLKWYLINMAPSLTAEDNPSNSTDEETSSKTESNESFDYTDFD